MNFWRNLMVGMAMIFSAFLRKQLAEDQVGWPFF